MCGKTGFHAALAHAPPTQDGLPRYIFFCAPHIGISREGEVGKVQRYSEAGLSGACGALLGVRKELEAGRIGVELDLDDMEQSVLKQKIVSRMGIGEGVPDLVRLTRIAEEVVLGELERMIEMTVGEKCWYAVVSGVQIHRTGDDHFFCPGSMYVVKEGNREELVLGDEKPTDEWISNSQSTLPSNESEFSFGSAQKTAVHPAPALVFLFAAAAMVIGHKFGSN